jgi:hypothetical protein
LRVVCLGVHEGWIHEERVVDLIIILRGNILGVVKVLEICRDVGHLALKIVWVEIRVRIHLGEIEGRWLPKIRP